MVTPAVDTERGTAAPGPDAPSGDADTLAGAAPDAPARAARRGRTVRRVVAVVLLLLLVAVVWLGVRGLQVVQSLRSAAPEVAAVHAALAAADVDAASAHLPALQEHAGAALAGTRDPVWRAASSLPWLGPQLRAVADVTAALDLTATDVVPAVAELADVVRPDALAPVDGVVPLAPLVAA
ncbi:hypothetical protein ICW40_12655, partial [Actinotalea ferrariae]|nr:hypothetical protein [Actinotalea ferrariae]